MIDQFCFENKMKNLIFCPLKYNLKIYMTRQKENCNNNLSTGDFTTRSSKWLSFTTETVQLCVSSKNVKNSFHAKVYTVFAQFFEN